MNEACYRHEFKYLVSEAQIALLKSRITPIMKPDPHAGRDGAYNIRSLYFDSFDNRCYFENENGTEPREKFRIRIYNHSSERITLECKKKKHGMTLKTTCPITLEYANRIIDGQSMQDLDQQPPLLRKLELKRQAELFRPVILVEYERIPFVYRDGNVRITFDRNIASSNDLDRFFEEEIEKRPVMSTGQHLMEVKYDTFLPDFIYQSLNLGTLSQTSYSKYYLCRKYDLR